MVVSHCLPELWETISNYEGLPETIIVRLSKTVRNYQRLWEIMKNCERLHMYHTKKLATCNAWQSEIMCLWVWNTFFTLKIFSSNIFRHHVVWKYFINLIIHFKRIHMINFHQWIPLTSFLPIDFPKLQYILSLLMKNSFLQACMCSVI